MNLFNKQNENKKSHTFKLKRLKNYRKCVMGCPAGKEKVHSFPKDPTRYADWTRILGVKPSVKTPYICSRHFSYVNFFGKKLSKYAYPNAELHKYSNPSIDVSESVPPPNNSSSSELQKNINLEGMCIENDIRINANVINHEDLEEDQEKEVSVTECLENSDMDDSCSQISALKLALDRCLKQLSEEKSQKKKLKQENAKLSKELEQYKKLTANLGSESCELKKHILDEVVQFLTEQEVEKVDKKSIYLIRSAGRYCDVNLINM